MENDIRKHPRFTLGLFITITTQDAEERSRVLQLHNKLTLKAEEVDFLSGLGRRLLAANPDYRRAVKSTLP